MGISVYLPKANYTKQGFDHRYLEIEMTEMLDDETEGNQKFIEYLLYDDYARALYKRVDNIEDLNNNEDIIVKFQSSDNEYIFNTIAQVGLSLELISFMWDMEHNEYDPLPGDDQDIAYN